MNRFLFTGGLVFVVVAANAPHAQVRPEVRLTASAQATAVKKPDTSTATNDQALVDKCCATCHNARTLFGNLSLAGLDVTARRIIPRPSKK